MKILHLLGLAALLSLTSCVGEVAVYESPHYQELKTASQISYTATSQGSTRDSIISIKNMAKVYEVEFRIEVTEGEYKNYFVVVVRGETSQVEKFDKSFMKLTWAH